MLSQRTVVPPGFTELASDSELAAQLGPALFGVLLRLCHLAEPSPDVPGGWCTTAGRDELAQHLSASPKTAAKWLADLQAAGLISRVDGKPLGRGLGATPTRYFITAIPGLTDPSPIRPGRFSPGKVSPGKNATVISYPAKNPHPSPSPAYAREELPDPVVDVSQSTQDQAKTPQWLTSALSSIGFIGNLPDDITAGVDPATVLQVIEAIKTRDGIDSPARYLNWLLRQGPTAIADFLGPQASDETPGPALMDAQEYLQLRAVNPAWDEHVRAAAQQLAEETGARMDLRVILQAAAATPLTLREAQ